MNTETPPSRRFTDRPPRPASAPESAKRLFARRSLSQHTDTSPRPRPRDEQGQALPRPAVHEHPLPDTTHLKATYQKAIDLVRQISPLQAAILEDLQDRTDTSLKRYRLLLEEEEERHQNFNEEIRRADEWIDDRILTLREKRQAEQAQQDQNVLRWQDERAKAREAAVIACAEAGLPVYGKKWETDDDDAPDEASDPPLGIASYTEVTNSESVKTSEVNGAGKLEIAVPFQTPRPFGGTTLPTFRGKISSHREGNPTTPETSVFAAPVVRDTAGGFRVERPPVMSVPLGLEFPLQIGRERARPVAAIALEHGFLPESPAHEGFRDGKPFVLTLLEALSLIACGGIFGMSLGLILKTVDLEMLSYGKFSAIPMLLLFVILGIALFWLMGRVISGLAGLMSEERHTSLLTRHPKDLPQISAWFNKMAIISAGIFLVGSVSLVVIEATVEREGIVNTFIERTQNHRIVTGKSAEATDNLSGAAILGLVLMVSVPFAYFHAAEGWITARRRVFKHYLEAHREVHAWELATDLHKEQENLAREKHLREHEADIQVYEAKQAHFQQEQEREQQRREFMDATYEVDLNTPELSTPLSNAEAPHTSATEEATSSPTVTLEVAAEKIQSVMATPVSPRRPTTEQRVEIARSEQRAHEAHYRLKEARAQRRDALVWYEGRIAELASQRLKENPLPQEESKQRLEDAYHDYISSVAMFDKAIRKECARVERYLAGGLWWRFRAWFGRKPISLS